MSSQQFSPFVKQCFVTLAICVNTISTGATAGFPGILLPQLEKPGSIIRLTSEQASWATSVFGLPMLVGNFLSIRLMDKYGRRFTQMCLLVPGVAGWLITAGATSFAEIIIGRLLQGFSFGLSMPSRSVILGEYTTPKHRGAFLTTISLTQSFGVFLVHLIGSAISWQQTALLISFCPFISLLMMIYCPESPSFLASKERYDECREVFHWLRGDSDDEELEELIEARMKFKDEEKVHGIADVFALMKEKAFYVPILSMIHAFAMMQFCGAPIMAAYALTNIKNIAGDVNINFWMLETDAQRFVMGIVAIFIIHKFKRRFMMFLTGSICVLNCVAIVLYVIAKEKGIIDKENSWIGLLLLNVQSITIAIGMIPLPSIFLGEIFPLRFRSFGNSIAVVSNVLTNFLVLKSFPFLVESLFITGAYCLYAGFMTYFLIVLWFLLPETKGKTLQQIEDELRGVPSKPEDEERINSYERDIRKMSYVSTHSQIIVS